MKEVKEIFERRPILREKIASACELPEERAGEALVEVLRFLDLVAAEESVLTPSPRVDEAWHQFILCTRDYGSYCDARYGRMIHHTPGGTRETNRAQFRRTLSAYALTFGPPPVEFWGAAAEAVPDAGCGACEGDPTP